MRTQGVSIRVGLLTFWARRRRLILQLTSCFLFVFLSTGIVRFVPEAMHLIWPANGVLLAYMLLAPRRNRNAYLLTGFAALGLGCALVENRWQMNLLFTVLNTAEVGLSSMLLRRRSKGLPRFAERNYLVGFIAFAVLVCPLAGGAVNALIAVHFAHIPSGWLILRWASADGLGAAIATPGVVAVLRTRFDRALRSRWNLLHLFLTGVITWLVFVQDKVPLPFILFPLLLLVLLRMGLGWAAMATLYQSSVGSWYTLRGYGPFASSHSLPAFAPAIMLQIQVSCAMFMLYSVSVVLESRKRTERRLKKIASLHGLITENSRDAIILADLNGSRRYVSSASTSLGGWSPEELMKQGSFDLVHPDDLPRAKAAVERLATAAECSSVEVRVRKRDGEYAWVESSLRVARDPNSGKPYGVLNILRDISERRRTEQAHEFHNSLVRAIHEVTLDGILVVDGNENIAAINGRFFDVWRVPEADVPADGFDEEKRVSDRDLLSKCMAQTKDPDAFCARVQELYANPNLNDSCNIELIDGRVLERYTTGLRSESGKYLGRVWFFRDITDRMHAEKRLHDAYRAVEVLAVTDALTGLANRRQLDQCLATELRRGMRDRKPLSLLLIDVDLFKSYNDSYGHLHGDACLRQIAEATQDVVVRPGDLVARFGGEEFAVILPNTTKDGASEVASEILEALRGRGIVHKGSPFGVVTVSIGSATLTPQLGQSSAALIELADRALYNAKRLGRNRACGGGLECFTAVERIALGLESVVSNRAS